MASQPISTLPLLGVLADNDLLPVVDVSEGDASIRTKKTTVGSLKAHIGSTKKSITGVSLNVGANVIVHALTVRPMFVFFFDSDGSQVSYPFTIDSGSPTNSITVISGDTATGITINLLG